MVVVAVGPYPPASSELVAATWSAMPSLKLVTNLICGLLASGVFCRVQKALIVCHGVSLWKTTSRPNIETPFGREGGGGREVRRNPEQMRKKSAVMGRRLKH